LSIVNNIAEGAGKTASTSIGFRNRWTMDGPHERTGVE